MNKLSVFITLLSLFFSTSSFSATLKNPNKADIESTCRTLLYQVTQEKGNKEKIVVLNATYKMICTETSGENFDLIHQQFSGIGNSLAGSGACLSSSGFISSGIQGGWTHYQIKRFQELNKSTGGGWQHMVIKNYMDLSPYVRDLSKNEFLKFKALTQSNYELEQLDGIVENMNKHRIQQLQPQNQNFDSQIEVFDLESLHNVEINRQ